MAAAPHVRPGEREPASTDRCTSSDTSTSSRKTSLEPGVDPRHLEQVTDHALEAAQVVTQQLQRPLGARREVVLLRLEDLE